VIERLLKGGDFCGFALEDLPSGVCGTVVHQEFLFLPYPKREAGGAGQVGVDKKMKSAEHLVATKRWV
jgi:hypothetical protein